MFKDKNSQRKTEKLLQTGVPFLPPKDIQLFFSGFQWGWGGGGG